MTRVDAANARYYRSPGFVEFYKRSKQCSAQEPMLAAWNLTFLVESPQP